MKKKGKGLTFDQKREKMLAIFHSTRSVFNFAQIEKASIKAGIPFPAVKEILKSLQADSLVQCQKIGAGVFYWSFPSKTCQVMTDQVSQHQKRMEMYQEQNKRLLSQIKEALPGREDTEQRKELIDEIKVLSDKQKLLNSEVEKYIRFDPQRVELLKKQNKELKLLINAETDNLEQIKKYIKKSNPGTTNSQIEQIYQIPCDLNYFQ